MDVFYIISIIVGYIAYAFGGIAFSQIVGSIRARKHLLNIIFWCFLTIVLCGVVYVCLAKYIFAVAIGLAISLIIVLFTPEVE